ncbi:MAG: AAA family ATPase, partial [Polyangia bacterium]
GQGGAALVFRAINEETGQVVALKTAREPTEARLASVRREIQALARIRHAGVVNIFEGGVFEGRPWYTMELIQGATLGQHLRGFREDEVSRTTELPDSLGVSGPADLRVITPMVPGALGPTSPWSELPAPTAKGGEISWTLEVVRRLCDPLAYIHGEGFVHRDLKPSNIFVRSDGTPILMDFGLVWWVREEGQREVLAVDAARGGTIAYMAPEQARGNLVDARADLFSLGCIIYEILTGRPPYLANTRLELAAAHDHPAVPPSKLGAAASPELEALVMALLERNPRDRIGHADDVAALLADVCSANTPAPAPAIPARAYLYRPEIVGRQASIDAALAPIDRLRRGRGGIGIVTGESGIGKTTFVSEVARRTAAQRIRVVTSECAAVGMARGRSVPQSGPLYPFRRILQAIADRCVAGGSALADRILGERAKILAIVEPSLRHLPGIQHHPEPPEMPSEAARRRIIDALAETLSAFSADKPTLLVIDDLQWADDLTLAFLDSLSANYLMPNPLFLLGTYRLEESTPLLERLNSAPHVSHFRLDRLDATTIGTMSADMLGQHRVSDALVAFLSAESSGNPFFVAEYLRAAVDAGLLFRDGRGRWQQPGGPLVFEKLGLPRNLRDLVARRIEGLGENARRLAEMTAVLGREVEIEFLTSVTLRLGIIPDEAMFDDVLRELIIRQVLEPSVSGSVRFVHDKLREIVYEAIAPARQKHLHAGAAELLEQSHSERGDLDSTAASLAHHFEKGGDIGKALFYFDAAGEAAHRMHANQEAMRLIEKARTLEERAPVKSSRLARARRARLLGLDALALGNVNEALTRLKEATVIAGKPWPRTRFVMVLRCLASLSREVARRWLVKQTGNADSNTARREMLLEAGRAYERLMVVNYFATGDMLAVVLAATVNIGLAEQAGGPSSERALGYASFAAMCSFLPFDGVARAYCRRALDDTHSGRDDVAETWVRMNVAMVHLQAGRWRDMETELEEVRTMARRMGFKRRWEEATSEFSTARLLNGRFTEAAALNAELSGAIERADPQTKCWAVVRDAELALLAGDLPTARRASEEGEAMCRLGLGFAEWIYALGPLALAQLRAGDPEGARRSADLCVDWMTKGSAPVFYNINAYAAVVEVYLSLVERAPDAAARRELVGRARRAVKRLAGVGRVMPVASPRACYWRGVAAVRLGGQGQTARRWFRKGMARARALEMAYDEALALAALGEWGADVVDNQRILRQALKTFEELGAGYDKARVEALLPA